MWELLAQTSGFLTQKNMTEHGTSCKTNLPVKRIPVKVEVNVIVQVSQCNNLLPFARVLNLIPHAMNERALFCFHISFFFKWTI